MTSALNDQSLDQIFRSARSPNGSTDRPVEENTVREIYDLMTDAAQLFAMFGLVAAEPAQGS
jgi:hypothetical protein